MRTLRWRVAVALLCGGTLFVSGMNVLSSASDVAESPPSKITAQFTSVPSLEGPLSGQPFVPIAKLAKASVVNVSSVKKAKQEGQSSKVHSSMTHSFVGSLAKNSSGVCRLHANFSNRAWALV